MISTFQAIVYAAVLAFTEFLPVSRSAHEQILPELLKWDTPPAELRLAIIIGALIALVFSLIHDWASILSSLLRVVLLRKKPMTLDERMPFFLLLTWVPYYLVWRYALPHVELALPSGLYWTLGGLVFFGAFLPLGEALNRKQKKMFDWNWVDSIWIGLTQVISLLPGAGRQAPVLFVGAFRNYIPEVCSRIAFFSLLPFLITRCWILMPDVNLQDAVATGRLSWLSFGIALAVSVLSGMLAINAFNKSIQTRGVRGFFYYRCLLAGGVLIWILLKG